MAICWWPEQCLVPCWSLFQKRFICCILHNFWTISVLIIFCFLFCICICITFGALLIVCKGAPFVTRVFITSRLNTHFLSTPPHPGQLCLLLVVATCTIGYSTICSCFHFLLFMLYYLLLLFATTSSTYVCVATCTICGYYMYYLSLFIVPIWGSLIFVTIGLFAPPGPGVKSLARRQARYFTFISFAFLSWAPNFPPFYFSVVWTTVHCHIYSKTLDGSPLTALVILTALTQPLPRRNCDCDLWVLPACESTWGQQIQGEIQKYLKHKKSFWNLRKNTGNFIHHFPVPYQIFY